MIARLFQQDPAIRTLRASVPVALAAGFMIAVAGEQLPSFTRSSIPGGKAGWLHFALAIVWFYLMILLLACKISSRTSRLSLTLPIAARKLWTVRIVSILAGGLVPLGLVTLLIAYRGLWGSTPVPDSSVLWIGGQLAAGLVLAVLLLQTPGTRLYRMEINWAFGVYGIFMASIVLVVVLVSPLSPLSVILPLAIALALGIRLFVSLPRSLSICHLEPEDGAYGVSGTGYEGNVSQRSGVGVPTGGGLPAETRTGGEHLRSLSPAYQSAAIGEGRSFRRLLHLSVWRILLNRPLPWIALVTLCGQAMLLRSCYSDGRAGFHYFVILAVWWYALIGYSTQRLKWLDPLPVSRKILFLHVVVAGLVATGVGFGTIELRNAADPHPPGMVNYDEYNVRPPEEFNRIAWGGRPPAATSAWGESHTPTAYPVLPGLKAAVYNPFERGSESTPEFIALQIDRAIEAVHGVALSPEYEDPGFRLDDSYKKTLSACCLRVEGSVGRGSEVRSRTFALTGLLVILITTLLVVLLFVQGRSTLRAAVYRRITIGVVIMIALVFVEAFLLQALGISKAWAVAAFPMILIRGVAEQIPVSTGALWALIGLSVVGSYLILQSRYRYVEASLMAKEANLLSED